MDNVNLALIYYKLNQHKKADDIISVIINEFEQDLIYFNSLSGQKYENVTKLKKDVLNNLERIQDLTLFYKRLELKIKIDEILKTS